MLLPIQVDTNMASNHFPEYLAYKKLHWTELWQDLYISTLDPSFPRFWTLSRYWTVDDFIIIFFAFSPIRQKPRFWTMERQHVKYQASFSLSLQKEKGRRNAWSQVKMPPKITRPNETRLWGRCKKGKSAKEAKREGSTCYKHQCFCIPLTIFWQCQLSIRDQSQVGGFSAWSELNYFVYRKLSSQDAFFKWYHNRAK